MCGIKPNHKQELARDVLFIPLLKFFELFGVSEPDPKHGENNQRFRTFVCGWLVIFVRI